MRKFIQSSRIFDKSNVHYFNIIIPLSHPILIGQPKNKLSMSWRSEFKPLVYRDDVVLHARNLIINEKDNHSEYYSHLDDGHVEIYFLYKEELKNPNPKYIKELEEELDSIYNQLYIMDKLKDV